MLQAFLDKYAHLWVAPKDWRAYEQYVSGSLKRRFPHAEISMDQKLRDLKSGTSRQIDILIFSPQQVAIDCKCYGRKVHVKHVEAFLGMLDDLNINLGVLVTTKGYTKAALLRAKSDPRKIDLQILSPDRLSEYQHVGAPLIWRDTVGIFLECPKGWVTDSDGTSNRGYLVAMYPLGHTLESAQRHAEFLYANILRKDGEQSLEAVAAPHEAALVADGPQSTFRHDLLTLTDQSDQQRQAFLRTAANTGMNFGVEHSLYVDYGTHVLLLVILVPPKQTEKMQNLVVEVAKNSFEMVVDDKRPPRTNAD